MASLKRTAADVTRRLNAGGYGGNFDVGAAFTIPLDAFFLNIAPAFSIFYIAAEHTRWEWPKNTCYEESFEDDVFGVGITADVYVKYRRKNFVCAVGLAASYYPVAYVSSLDSEAAYEDYPDDEKIYSLRPYIAPGFSVQ